MSSWSASALRFRWPVCYQHDCNGRDDPFFGVLVLRQPCRWLGRMCFTMLGVEGGKSFGGRRPLARWVGGLRRPSQIGRAHVNGRLLLQVCDAFGVSRAGLWLGGAI